VAKPPDVELRFASNTVRVPDDEVAEFERRLAAKPNGQAAADELRAHRRFVGDDQKSLALSAVNEWMREVDNSKLSEALKDVRYELMRDLRLPPFDD
jgi:hypothetical protein